jgi:hypothetical protein
LKIFGKKKFAGKTKKKNLKKKFLYKKIKKFKKFKKIQKNQKRPTGHVCNIIWVG